MKDVTIDIDIFDPESIEKAINEVRKQKRWVADRCEKLRNALAEEGLNTATIKFETAIYDGTNDVQVEIEEVNNHTTAVVASGFSLLFIEFGTGITYPDDHPLMGEYGFARGKYGYGLGSMKGGWRYKGEPGTNGELITEGPHAGEIKTLGNPANQCMYLTGRELIDKISQLVGDIFT